MANPADISRLKIERGDPAAPPDPRARRRRRLKPLLGLLALGALALFAGRQLAGQPGVEVGTVALAYPVQNYTLLNATGYAVAQRKAAIASKASGRLEWLGVLEGSRVKRGELIARLENGDVSAALGQARANVQLAQANLEQGQAELLDAGNAQRRAAELLAQKFIAAATYDAAQARLNKARAALAGMRAAIAADQANARAAQVALDQTMIRAPFDGVILTKNANVGDNITPFSSATDSKGAVVTMADMDTLEVEADVSESNLARIGVGQPAEIQFDAFPALRLAGQVSRMVPTVDRSKATLLVKVRFLERDARVLPDMSAKVAFLSHPVPALDKRPVPAVAPAALATRDGQPVLFVLDGDRVRQRALAPGRKIGDLVEVAARDGARIAPGTRIVLHPAARLRDGQRVDVNQNKTAEK